MSDQKKIGTVVIGKNLADAIEIFEYEFLVKAILNRDEAAVELNDYYPADDYSELGDLTSFLSTVGTTISDQQATLSRDGFWGYQDARMGVSVIAVPLSDFSKVDESRLVVVKNEREAMAKAA